jgi:MFS transporter, DHA2 family, multidrug resistance protein
VTDAKPTVNRAAITVCVILATVMQALDTTIANVALPYIQGSVSASQDEINWVLTSYIVAAAIITPSTGFFSGRFGLKRFFLVCVAGFTGASMLCGMAQSLEQIVLFRVLQGVFGAALVPLSQTTLMNINPPERQGSAMALWGMAVMAGPVLGPVMGGWLTDNYTWRYVFYINLPIGLLAFLGISTFLPETSKSASARMDWIGFGSLGVAIGAFQIMLDRGQEMDWFSSKEIITEAVIAAFSFYIFLAHTFTADAPFVRPALFRDRNFAAGTLFVAIVGLTYYASLALQPPFLQTLMNYPIVTAGLVMGPRGVGTMISMMVVGRLIGRVDTRILLAVGLSLTSWSFFEMTGWTPDVSQSTIITIGIIQGMGLGFIFVPLSVVALATLPPLQRAEGAAIYSLARNIGSSAGISIVSTLLTQNTQINHAEIIQKVTPLNRMLDDPIVHHFWDPMTEAGRTALNEMITRQAEIIAYIDNYKLLMLATLGVIPLLIVFQRPRTKRSDHDHALALE